MQLTDEQRSLIEAHLDAVIEMNTKINLTRIDDHESGMVLHIEDSLSALPEFSECPEGRYADLGTGGGFPGVTLSIATGRDVLLVDSVSKKMKALDSMMEELGLSSQVTTYAGRIEDLSIQEKGQFSVLTARALSSLPSLLELASPLLKIGGRVICYKGSSYQEELDRALPLQKKLGMKHVSTRVFELSDGSPRAVIVFEKAGKPKLVLPRRVGMAQKHPFA